MAMRLRPRVLWIALIVAAPVLLSGGFVTYRLLTLPDIDYLVRENPSETALMAARCGERTQLWAPLADISPRLVEAVLMALLAGGIGFGRGLKDVGSFKDVQTGL